MRDFIMQRANTLKFIVNYHSYGNMFLIPYQGSDGMNKLTTDQAKIYNEIKTEAKFPPGMKSGNAKELLNYHANGEASDWALSKAGIISMSPELASESVTSYTFDMPSVREEARVILENLGLPFYLLDKASPQLEIVASKNKSLKVDVVNRVIQFEIELENKGMSDANNLSVSLAFNDAIAQVKGSVVVGTVKARSSKALTLRLSGISDETLGTLAQIFAMGDFAKDRVGLNVDFVITYDGAAPESSTFYIPVGLDQLSSSYMVSLMEIETKHGQ